MNEKDLIDAILEDDKDKFWLCVDREVDMDSKTSDGTPMLILAVKFKRTDKQNRVKIQVWIEKTEGC